MSQPQCWLGCTVVTLLLPVLGGFPSPPPPVLASTELPSPCWAPATAELSYQPQETKDQNLSCSHHQAYGEETLSPFVPGLLACRFPWVFALIPGHKAEGEGKGEIQQNVKEAQEQPGPP